MSETRGRRLTRRVHQRLHERVRAVGQPGAEQRIEEAVGRHAGWLRSRRRAGQIDLGQLINVLDVLGEDKQRFFRLALDEEGEEDGYASLLGVPPPIVTLARARLATARQGEPLAQEELTELDRLRYSEPRRALALAEAAAPRTPRALLPRLLGVAASTYRILIQLDQGEHTIAVAMKIAHTHQDRSALGDLCQRLAYIAADRGDHAEGLRLAERATNLHVHCLDPARIGQSLVEQGMMLLHLGRPNEAIMAEEAALKYLPESEGRYRFSALHHLGFGYLTLGDVERAQEYAQQAREIFGAVERPFVGKLIWLQASISETLGQLDQAEEQLRSVVEIFLDLHLGDSALATTELVRIQLLRGKAREAYETAKSMLSLLEPLRDNRIVSAAIADLLRGGAAGLSLALVEQVKTTLEAARARPEWRSLAAGVSV